MLNLRLPTALSLALCLSAPAVLAQDVPPTFASATLVVESADGAKTQSYKVDDITFMASRSMNYNYDNTTEPRADISTSLSNIRPLDSFLLEWANQVNTGADASRKITVTAPALGDEAQTVCVLEGARVTSLSSSHSAAGGSRYFSLQLNARKASIDGIALN